MGTPGSGTRQKRDPAWKHCESIVSEEGKAQIRCNYCTKLFKGGGIYRIKEHLAGQKGNGVTCKNVLPDVKREMLDCLNEIMEKKGKHQKLLEGVPGGDNPGTSAEGLNNLSGQNGAIESLSMDEIFENDSSTPIGEDVRVKTTPGGRLQRHGVSKDICVVETDATPLNVETASGTRPKRDPAWKHCKMCKNDEGKVWLKCNYCGKIFRGGGIFRIKEHLAGQKGNGVTCTKVEHDVRIEMLECLSEVSGEKRKSSKKQKKLDFKPINSDPGTTSGAEVVYNHSGAALSNNPSNFELDVLPMNEILGHESNGCVGKEDWVYDKSGGTNPKKRIREEPDESNGFGLSTNMKKASTEVQMAVGRFFFNVGLPMDAVNSAYFQPMIDAIASQGRGTLGPSYNDLRSWILKNSVEEVRKDVDQCREAWAKTGCSVLVQEWNSVEGKTFVNFLVYSHQGTIFLRSVDISSATDSSAVLHDLMRDAVEEVGVSNVLQVMTSCEERYVIAGEKLRDTYPSVFWTPCAGHCIDLMLKDIGELSWVNSMFDQAKSISRYIYSNSMVLNMMRRFTSGVDLVDPSMTRSSSDFMTLKRILSLRSNLELMFTSEEWMESPCSKTPEGIAILEYVTTDSFWSTCASVTRVADPLLRVLRIVGSGKMPAMGFVYAGLYRAKETIKKELVDEKEYSVYWNIIDHRWQRLQRHALYAAGFYFNPKFFYSLEEDAIYDIRSKVYDCIERVVPELQTQDKIMRETTSYKDSVGDFGRKMAIRARDTSLPAEWWSIYGGGCPNLTRLAICILSQCCSLIQYNKLNKIPLELMHEWKNCLEHRRLSDLVFVQYNMSLKQMVLGKEQENADPISYENMGVVGDWVAERNVGPLGLHDDWTAIDQPSFDHIKFSDPENDDIEALSSGFDDYEILKDWKDDQVGIYS